MLFRPRKDAMFDPSQPLPSTLEACHAQMRAMMATIEQQQATIEQQQTLLESLQRDLALLKRSMFGHRRERFDDPLQGTLFDSTVLNPVDESCEDATTPEAADTAATSSPDDDAENSDKTKNSNGGRTSRGRQARVFPEALPREKHVQRLSDEEVSEEDRERGRLFEKLVAQWVELKPPELVVIEEYVEVLATDNADATETTMQSASPQSRIIGSFAGPSLLAAIATNRFADHLPYYRLEEILSRSGIEIDRATQTRWMCRLAEPLTPLVDLMRARVLACPVIQADETPVNKLEPGLGRTSKSYLWAVLGTSPYPYTTFYYTSDRSRAGPDSFFETFSGTLVSDAYICYERLNEVTHGRILMAGCHVHARRKFEALHKLGATTNTATALGYFQRLFAMEDQLSQLSAEQRHCERQIHCRPLMVEFKAWLDEKLTTLRPKDALRGAISYMVKRWDCFTRFLESGLIPVDNNASERAVKLPVLGKKNWMFFGNDRGGETAATMYTLTSTCRDLKIDPQAYLTDAFQRLPLLDTGDPTALEPLLPDQWLAAHPESRLTHRVNEAADRANRKTQQRAQRRKRFTQI